MSPLHLANEMFYAIADLPLGLYKAAESNAAHKAATVNQTDLISISFQRVSHQ